VTVRSGMVQLVYIHIFDKNYMWEATYFCHGRPFSLCDTENFAHTPKKKSLNFWSRRYGNDFLWHPWSTCKIFWKIMYLKSFLQRGFRIYKEGPKKKKYWKKLDRWKVRCAGAEVQYLDSLTRLRCCRVRLSWLYMELTGRVTLALLGTWVNAWVVLPCRAPIQSIYNPSNVSVLWYRHGGYTHEYTDRFWISLRSLPWEDAHPRYNWSCDVSQSFDLLLSGSSDCRFPNPIFLMVSPNTMLIFTGCFKTVRHDSAKERRNLNVYLFFGYTYLLILP